MEKGINTFNDSQEEELLDILDLLIFLLRRWKVIAAAALAGLLIAAIYVTNIATPMYEATSQIYVVNSKDSALDLSDLQIGSYLTADYQLVFKTWEVNLQVIQNLNLPYSVGTLQKMVKVENPSNTRALFITCTSPDAREAAVIANEFANVGSQYISDTMLTDMPSILSTALEPLNPVSPRKTITILIGFLLGMMLAVGGLVVFYISNDKIKTSADVVKYIGAEPLAVVPLARSDRAGDRGRRKV